MHSHRMLLAELEHMPPWITPGAPNLEAIAVLPQVAEVAVVAVPDERLGEHACAIARLAPGSAALDLREITALSDLGLARQKWPEELRVVDDFPRTASGKIRKVDLRAQLRAESG